MYNLLMRYSSTFNEWESNEGRRYDARFLRERVFEYTDEVVKKKYTYPHTDSPDFDALKKLPCLFTYEGQDVIGEIGRISSVTSHVRGLELIYSLPKEYPKIRISSDDTLAVTWHK